MKRQGSKIIELVFEPGIPEADEGQAGMDATPYRSVRHIGPKALGRLRKEAQGRQGWQLHEIRMQGDWPFIQRAPETILRLLDEIELLRGRLARAGWPVPGGESDGQGE